MSAAELTSWRSGPPPCVGWWNASTRRDPQVRRYWNGKRWSRCVMVGVTSDVLTEHLKTFAASRFAQTSEWRGLAKEPKS